MEYNRTITLTGCFIAVTICISLFLHYNLNIWNVNHNIGLDEPKIPRIIWFTYKYDILSQKEPDFLYKNIQKTISSFRIAWKNPMAKALVLDDKSCIDMLDKVDPNLTQLFLVEKIGAYKGDICRLAALYLHGGYYFDVDMEVVTPILLPKDVSFSTVVDYTGEYFFNSFMASSPMHPILMNYINVVLEYYSTDKKSYCRKVSRNRISGPCMLWYSYNKTQDADRGLNVFLQEQATDDEGTCGFHVVNQVNNAVHFNSRIKGSYNCPYVPRMLWFDDFVESTNPLVSLRNAQKAVNIYRELWGNNLMASPMNEYFCISLLRSFESDYELLKEGKYEEKICQVVSLYKKGGYYIFLGLRVISPFEIPEEVSFVAVKDKEYLSSSFIAVEPNHPIIKEYLNLVLEYHFPAAEEKNNICHKQVDSNTVYNCLLWQSYHKIEPSKRMKTLILQTRVEARNMTDKIIIESPNRETLFEYDS